MITCICGQRRCGNKHVIVAVCVPPVSTGDGQLCIIFEKISGYSHIIKYVDMQLVARFATGAGDQWTKFMPTYPISKVEHGCRLIVI